METKYKFLHGWSVSYLTESQPDTDARVYRMY